MRLRSLIAAAFILVGATVITVAAIQLRSTPTGAAPPAPAANENSAQRLPIPPGLPVLQVEDPW